MIRIPIDDFGDWINDDENDVAKLPRGFAIRTRVRLGPQKGLPEYLKSKGAQGFTMGARSPENFGYLTSATLDSLEQIERKGWKPRTVEVILRWDPALARESNLKD